MKLEIIQESDLGRLTVRMEENCHGDSTPPVDAVHFNGVHEWIAPDTAALAAAIVASRWTGEVMEFKSLSVSADAAEAARLIAEDARFVMPIDGYRRNLCEGHMDVLVAPAAMAGLAVSTDRSDRVLTRLVTWSGEFVAPSTRCSAGHLAGEVSTNANILLPAWEISVCLGLFVGGSRLRSIVVPGPGLKQTTDFERFAHALRIVGVQLRAAEPTPRPSASPGKARARRRFIADTELAEKSALSAAK